MTNIRIAKNSEGLYIGLNKLSYGCRRGGGGDRLLLFLISLLSKVKKKKKSLFVVRLDIWWLVKRSELMSS